jgi:hypothetical protein
MASRPVLITALYDQFFSFTKELQEMYPDDADFSLFTTTLKMLKSSNPSLLVKYIYDNTIQFEEKILNQDEAFFLDYSFSEYGNDVDLNIFSKLKQYFAKMNQPSKDSVWKYIQNIFRLSKALSS